jgi:hypothetical protein
VRYAIVCDYGKELAVEGEADDLFHQSILQRPFSCHMATEVGSEALPMLTFILLR